MAYIPPSCSETKINCPSVFVSNDLVQLIRSERGERYHHYTHKAPLPPTSTSKTLSLMKMDELLKHVKDYILKHKLFDKDNPLKILLHENELGSMLGRTEVSLFDVKDILLEKFVFPVTHTSKEKNSSELTSSINERQNVCISKKRKLDNGGFEFSAKSDEIIYKGGQEREREEITFINEIDKREICFDTHNNSDESESLHSYQDFETEFVQDSTSDRDDNFGLILAETVNVDVEYEILSQSDGGGEYFSCESDSDLEDFVKTAIISFIAESTDSDFEYLADKSSDNESENELSEEDKWTCTSCGKESHPLMRCCSFCWTTRTGWLSERSPPKREQNERVSRKRLCSRSKKKRERKLFSKKSIYKRKGSQSDRNFLDLPSSTQSLLSTPSSCNISNVFSCQSPSNTPEVKSNTEFEKQLCIFCCAKPADSTILHGKVSCQVCCFSCGKKIFAENDRCPVCRRSIERIVYVYNL